jgi:ABC-type lipoprotein export system ATPase subunit
VFSTHDPQLMSHGQEIYSIRDGKPVDHRSEAGR